MNRNPNSILPRGVAAGDHSTMLIMAIRTDRSGVWRVKGR
jgi:hypothetical protein